MSSPYRYEGRCLRCECVRPYRIEPYEDYNLCVFTCGCQFLRPKNSSMRSPAERRTEGEWVDAEVVDDDEYTQLKRQRLAENVLYARYEAFGHVGQRFADQERRHAARVAAQMQRQRARWIRTATMWIWINWAWFAWAAAWAIRDAIVGSYWMAGFQVCLMMLALYVIRANRRARTRWQRQGESV